MDQLQISGGFPLLSLLIFLPLAGGLVLLFVRGEQFARLWALGVTTLTALATVPLLVGFDPSTAHYQFAELNRIAYAVHDAHERLESLERRQDGLEHQLHDKKLPDDKRRHLREELRDLDHDIDRARDELRWREFDLDRAYMMPWR